MSNNRRTRDVFEEPYIPQRRIRHISSIQVRNLTPFPARDAFTSLLIGPPPPGPLAISDDLDIEPSNARRARRMSASSGRALRRERSLSPTATGIRDKPRAPTGSPRSSPRSLIHRQGHGHRPSLSSESMERATDRARENISSNLSQVDAIQRILSSRLVETFVTLSSVLDDDLEAVSLPPGLQSQPTSPSPRRPQTSARKSSRPSKQSPRTPAVNGKSDTVSPQINGHHTSTPRIPFFISRTHRASTNPLFDQIDPATDFADWVDQSGTFMTVTLWGRTEAAWEHRPTLNTQQTVRGRQWTALEEWIFDTGSLTPLSPSKDSNFMHLPPNSLVLRFSNSPQLFLLESPPSSSLAISSGDTPSPESQFSMHRIPTAPLRTPSDGQKLRKSETWQDLVGLLLMHTSLKDTMENMKELLDLCQKSSDSIELPKFKRQASRLSESVKRLRRERKTCAENSDMVAGTIGLKRKELDLRRRNMDRARRLQVEALGLQHVNELKLANYRQRLREIEYSISRRRGSLFTSLSFVFPIELISASDLLFGILEIPLPPTGLPLEANSPQPSPQVNVSDDTVASALGHLSQVVHLSAAYLGQSLPYPITCIGSRSNIKDPISLMAGPRKFPLYSRGVDAYRYEYAVYLLNKNIEILMSVRDLKAMELGHSLANIKNLMLSLSTGEQESSLLKKQHPLQVTVTSEEGIEEAQERPEGSTKSGSGSARSWKALPFGSSWSMFRTRGASASDGASADPSVVEDGVQVVEGNGSALEGDEVEGGP